MKSKLGKNFKAGAAGLKQKFSADRMKKQGISAAGTIAGFLATHAISKYIEEKAEMTIPLWANGGLTLATGFGVPLLLKDDMNLVKSVLLGSATYFAVKTMNQATNASFVPESLRTFFQNYTPQLGGTDDFPAYSYYNRGPLNLPVLGNLNYMAPMGNLSYGQSSVNSNSLLGMGDQYTPTPQQNAML